MRSLHRYASDAFMLVIVLHLLRELIYRRYFGFRWFTWISGVPLLWMALFAGIGGFWLVWDELAQVSAVATLEWFDWLNAFGEPLARNFLYSDSVDDRFFSLLVFLHIGLPLLLLLGMWVHIQRLTRPDTRPALRLGWGAALALLALAADPSGGQPGSGGSRAGAAVARVRLVLSRAQRVGLRVVAGHAVVARRRGHGALAGVSSAAAPPATAGSAGGPGQLQRLCALLRRLPVRGRHDGAASGQADRRADRRGRAVAVRELRHLRRGACPSSTPFRSVAELISGIDMPHLPIGQLRSRVKAQIARLRGEVKIVVFGCDRGADVRALQAA